MLDFTAFCVICYVLYKYRSHIIRGVKGLFNLVVFVVMYPIVWVKVTFTAMVANEEHKRRG